MNEYEQINGLWMPKFVQRNGVWVKRQDASSMGTESTNGVASSHPHPMPLFIQQIGQAYYFTGPVTGYLPHRETEEEAAVAEVEAMLKEQS